MFVGVVEFESTLPAQCWSLVLEDTPICTEERTWTPISSSNAGVLNLNYSRIILAASLLRFSAKLLASQPVLTTGLVLIVAEDGIEPPTSRLWALRAATALLRNIAGVIGFAPILLPPMGGGSSWALPQCYPKLAIRIYFTWLPFTW